MSRRLPQNAALCKLLGVDPKRPGERPMFRGDVVVVKSYTVHILEGISATYPERTYVDFPALKMEVVDEIIRSWYQSAGWMDMAFKDDQEYELPRGSIPLNWDWRNPTHIPGFDYDAHDDEDRKKVKAAKRLLSAGILFIYLWMNCSQFLFGPDEKRKERYERFAARRCAHCGKADLPPRSKCSQCHNAHYCSQECQKANWKEHKAECRTAGTSKPETE
ncbi:hypothetical protein DFH07DRAFT_806290 [Mycena maculata]|uniref:MYND-type domain-containing protein n=1 Tax=Mycena maculata TaxID=230809 RepID=A0AAD7JRY6_9AGAR|nr:hypothetical protein DFH07DRAFT_806290 [Mycena maculata]